MDFFVIYTVRHGKNDVRESMILFALTAEEAQRAFEFFHQPFIFGFVEVVEICEVMREDF